MSSAFGTTTSATSNHAAAAFSGSGVGTSPHAVSGTIMSPSNGANSIHDGGLDEDHHGNGAGGRVSVTTATGEYKFRHVYRI
jgi:hypothetical protein